MTAGDQTALSAALGEVLAALEARPLDEPRAKDGFAADVRALLDARVHQLGEGTPPGERLLVTRARANVLRLIGRECDEEARAAFDAATALAPEDGATWFDLGLLHKWRGRWKDAEACFARAAALGVAHRGVGWNLAIARTALGDAAGAALAWKSVGIDARAGQHLAEVPGLPPARVRVPSEGAGYAGDAAPFQARHFELPWAQPLSPCHGVLVTPTFGRAAVDYGDVVLWDGAPASVRLEDGEPVPRFPLLEVLRRWDGRRIPVVAARDLSPLAARLPEGVRLFVEAAALERVTARGVPGSVSVGEPSSAEGTRPGGAVRGKIVIPADGDLRAVRVSVEQAREAGVSLAAPALFEALGETELAGKHHRAWLALDRPREPV